MRGCGTRGQMQTDERPHRGAACWIRGWTKVHRQSEARYTFGRAHNAEMLIKKDSKLSESDQATASLQTSPGSVILSLLLPCPDFLPWPV